jgi:glycine dehydrogenase subunit 1
MTLLGGEGLARLARLNHARANAAAARLASIPGVTLIGDAWFNEFTVRLPIDAGLAISRMAAAGVLGGVPLGRLYPGNEALANALLVTATETVTDEDIEALALALEGAIA